MLSNKFFYVVNLSGSEFYVMDENRIEVHGNAKINLTLDIIRIRPDGYHEVAMIMQEVSLFDTLYLEKKKAGISLEIECLNGAMLEADERNLAWRAAQLIIDECNVQGGVGIKLIKRIPIAAGLAGGSTDAAAVLKGMNTLYDLNLSEKRLCDLGAKLGSDIPFCVMGGTMLSTGRGEILVPAPRCPEIWLVLAKPPIGISTPWAYKEYDKGYDGPRPNNFAMLDALCDNDKVAIGKLMCNVLEQVSIAAHPEIAEYKKIMLEHGAYASMMSGSGPTVFGLCHDEGEANKLAEYMRSAGIDEVHVARTVRKG